MTEIENKRPSRESCQDGIDRAIERFASDQERQRIEIALNRPQLLNPSRAKPSSIIQSSPTASTATAAI